MTDREHRLRERIDVLTDERDAARARLEETRRKLRRARSALTTARQARDLAKLRLRRVA